jgi:hypothetical protein
MDLDSELKELAAQLGAAADNLNEQLRSFERILASYKLGVRASVLLRPGEHGLEPEFLTFGKEVKEWRLLYESGSVAIPLTNASREIRSIATGRLQDLVAELLKEAALQITDVQKAAETVNQLITGLPRI